MTGVEHFAGIGWRLVHNLRPRGNAMPDQTAKVGDSVFIELGDKIYRKVVTEVRADGSLVVADPDRSSVVATWFAGAAQPSGPGDIMGARTVLDADAEGPIQ